MTHLVKIALEHADMFVSAINLEKMKITYQIFDFDGKPLSPKWVDEKMNLAEGKFKFSASRFLTIQAAMWCDHLINGTNYQLAGEPEQPADQPS